MRAEAILEATIPKTKIVTNTMITFKNLIHTG